MSWPRNRALTYLYSMMLTCCRSPSCFRGMHTCTFIYWFIGLLVYWSNTLHLFDLLGLLGLLGGYYTHSPSSFFHLSTDTHTYIVVYVCSFDKPIPLFYPQINLFQVPPLETYSHCADMGPLRGGGAGLFRRYSVL